MGYLIGLLLALAVAGLASGVGFDRERSFASTVLIVVASYYVLFAVMGASGCTLVIEILIASGFVALSVAGFRTNPWLTAAGIVGHGVFDLIHHLLIQNPGVPSWWPGFCCAFDVIFGGWLAALLMRRSQTSLRSRSG